LDFTLYREYRYEATRSQAAKIAGGEVYPILTLA